MVMEDAHSCRGVTGLDENSIESREDGCGMDEMRKAQRKQK